MNHEDNIMFRSRKNSIDSTMKNSKEFKFMLEYFKYCTENEKQSINQRQFESKKGKRNMNCEENSFQENSIQNKQKFPFKKANQDGFSKYKPNQSEFNYKLTQQRDMESRTSKDFYEKEMIDERNFKQFILDKSRLNDSEKPFHYEKDFEKRKNEHFVENEIGDPSEKVSEYFLEHSPTGNFLFL